MHKQVTSQLLMVRPANFSSNTETLETNKFQSGLNINDSQESIQSLAIEEFDNMVNLLRDHQITIFDLDDIKELNNTDALFPNNWVTFHQDNTAVIYPMMAKSRRKEKRNDILKYLEEFESFRIEKVVDLSYLEKDGFFLEGTGSMVLDRINKIVFACESSRTSINALEVFCKKLNYSSVVFEAVNDDLPIYHTNVMMSLGQETAFICSESIKDQKDIKHIHKLFGTSERKIIELSIAQMIQFAGNVLEVENTKGQAHLIMSEKAYQSLEAPQIQSISKSSKIIPIPLDTIEKYGGGSARCMIAEIFLQKS
jgi:hypothetical protein|tara:strand:- start:2152 stop:3084 length:933 start_codon:yes stop_codon:yes gene_type:complete